MSTNNLQPYDAALPDPYATLHHEDGYFTTKRREDPNRRPFPRQGPFRTEAYTAEQVRSILNAAHAHYEAQVRQLGGLARPDAARHVAAIASDVKRLADNFAGACAGCDPGEFATKERIAFHEAVDLLAAAAQCSNYTADDATRMAPPELQPGEHYAGAVLDAQGQHLHHLVLMAAAPERELNWVDASAWAESVGGALPTRQEQALLFANCKQHIEAGWHWSSEQAGASDAWCQFFDGGSQDDGHKSAELRARAVRRIAVSDQKGDLA